jgi:hypothetical protein
MKYNHISISGGQLKPQNLNELQLPSMKRPKIYPKVAVPQMGKSYPKVVRQEMGKKEDNGRRDRARW